MAPSTAAAIMAERVIRWDELSSEDLVALRDGGIDMAILPVGATEQHGRHLPLGVDTLSATAVAERVSAKTGIPVLPALAYGCSLGHSKRWPGTISLRPETLARLVLEIAEWVVSAGFRRLLLLNGHVTNGAPLRCGLENVRHEYPELRIALRSLWEISRTISEHYHRDAANFHANCAETSVMLALRPDLVDMDKAVDEPDRSAHCFFAYTVDKESVHGGVGTPTDATEEFGTELLDLCVNELSAQLEAAMVEGTPLETMPP
jgi:creatinine amidohydrolase